MACGLPFIANPVGGIPEILEKNTGYLFDTPEQLAGLIEHVVKNKKIREKMSKECRKKILTLEKPIVKQYEEIFKRAGVI
jgi:glycosyltransferase involved in cell wall biosynthesis